MYRFDKPFEEIDVEETLDNMKKILNFEGMMHIRDFYLKSSILTKEGKIGFYAETKNGIENAYMFVETKGERKKEV